MHYGGTAVLVPERVIHVNEMGVPVQERSVPVHERIVQVHEVHGLQPYRCMREGIGT